MNQVAAETLDRALHMVRVTVEEAQNKAESECTRAREEAQQATQALHATRSELEQVRAERDQLHAEHDQLHEAHDEAQARLHRSEEQAAETGRQLEWHRNYTRRLQDELLKLYDDLRAEDLPTLVLRISMNLTGAEQALFVDQSGTETLAAVGLDDLSELVSSTLHEYASAAAEAEEPIVHNESKQLPDGRELVNLAALPVATHGALRGIILVANKRDSGFSENDINLLLSIGRHAGVAIENHRLHQELRRAYLTTIATLADAIEVKDPYTRGHCEGVAEVAVRVAERMGWDDDQREKMRYAALLHDVGKIGVPDGILLKPGKLLPEEFAVIQRHAQIGCDLVGHIQWLEEVQPYILHHHERYDGSGYPQGLSGEEIPLGARIIGVVDALDAMTTTRPYRDPVSVMEAVAELRRCAGNQFDSEVVEIVAEVLAQARDDHDQTFKITTADNEAELLARGTDFDRSAASKATRAEEAEEEVLLPAL